MNIEKHIQALLYRYECVVIPGFGAFLTQRKPAQFNSAQQEFLPPQKTVSFNSQLSENDGLLANYITKAEEISYAEALRGLEKFVRELKSTLYREQNKALEHIGTFSLENEKMVFRPFYQCNYLVESYGMASVATREIARTQVKTISSTATEKSTWKNKAWKYAAVGAVLIGVSGFLAANWYSSSVMDYNIAEQQKAETQVEQKIQEATFVIDAPLPEITFKVARQSGKYHIVAGAFRKEKNAEKKVKQLQADGFKARQINANKYGLHPVIYNSYENRLEALKNLRKIKRTKNQEAWLLVKELK